MLSLQRHIFHDVRITFFCGTFATRMEITLKLRFAFVRHCDVFYYVKTTLFICSMYLRFFKTLEERYILVRSNYVWKWRDNYVSLLLVIVTYFLLRYNYVINLFDVVTFFDDVRNRFYFGTFELRMEIALQLRFVFVSHCHVFLLCHIHVICLLDVVTFFDDVRITLYFGMFESRTEIML